MDEIKSKKYSKEQIERARLNYIKYLDKNCSKERVAEILAGILKDYFPDDLCLAHLS